MYRKFFHTLETLSDNESVPLNTVLDQLSFNDSGLIPVITQDVSSKTVLIIAWMNLTGSARKTLATKRVTHWSRSRQELLVISF